VLQGAFEICLCSKTHHVRDAHELAPPVAFFHLAVDQVFRHLPPTHGVPSPSLFSPCPKMGRERIEIHIQPITGEERDAARSQELSQGMDYRMCHGLRTQTKMEHGKKLRSGVNSQPEPRDLLGVA
jgi:hypothetical protein